MKKARIPAIVFLFMILAAYMLLPGGSARPTFGQGGACHPIAGNSEHITQISSDTWRISQIAQYGPDSGLHRYVANSTMVVTGLIFCGDYLVISNMTGWTDADFGLTNNGGADPYGGGESLFPNSLGANGWQTYYNANFAATSVDYLDVRSSTPFSYDVTFQRHSFGPTPTPGPSPTLSGSSGTFFGSCFLLGDDTANFRNLPGLWSLSGDFGNPPGQSQGLLMPVGIISLPLNLDPSAEYQVQIDFHLGTSPASQDLSYSLGSGPPISLSISRSTDEQHYSSGYSQWQADLNTTNQFTFQIITEQFDVTPDLVVDHVCVLPNGQQTNTGSTPLVVTDCSQCLYAPKGGLANLPDDAVALFNWLFCGIKRLITCILAGFLNGIWKVVIDIITMLAFVRLWASQTIQRAIIWVLTTIATLWAWLGGTANNIIQTVLNALRDFFNRINLVGIINSILDFFRNLIGGALSFILEAVNSAQLVIGIVGAIFTIILAWLSGIVQAVARVIIAIPVFFQALSAGYNTPASSIPVYVPTCSNPSSLLFWPCVGSYVLDNTILDGPLYLLLIVGFGALALVVIMWALRHVQETLAQ